MSRELMKRIVLTIAILLIIRAMAIIPLPGINTKALLEYYNMAKGSSPLSFLWGAFRRTTIPALGIMPYLSASVFTVLILYLLKFRKGIDPRSINVAGYTIALTIFFCILQAYGIAIFLENIKPTHSGLKLVPHLGVGFRLLTIVTITAATLVIIWLVHVISRKGIGNGICLIILVGTLSMWLQPVSKEIGATFAKNREPLPELFMLALILGLFFLSVQVLQAKQKIPLLNPTGTSEATDEPNLIPDITLRFNTMGVFPIKFLLNLLFLPLVFISTFSQSSSFLSKLSTAFNYNSILFWVALFILLPLSAYFWVAVAYNPSQLLRTLKRFYGSKIDGELEVKIKTRMDGFLARMTLPFLLFLLALLVFPLLLKLVGKTNFYISASAGARVVVVVAIILDVLRQFKSLQVMYHYRTKGKKSEELICDVCKESINEKDDYCPNCGSVFSEQYKCSIHSEEAAVGVCVVCHKHLCQMCAIDNGGRVCCEEHADLEIIEGWVNVHSPQTGLEAELFKDKLEKEKIPCQVVSNTIESMYGTLGFWEISPVVPFAVHRELGGGEIKVMVPVDKFESVEDTK